MVTSFLGWFTARKGEWLIKRIKSEGGVFFFAQALGSVGLGGFMFFGEGVLGFLCLRGGLGLKMGTRIFHS